MNQHLQQTWCFKLSGIFCCSWTGFAIRCVRDASTCHRKYTIVQNDTIQQNSTQSASSVSQAVLLDMMCRTQRQMLTVLPCFSEEDSLHCPDNECCHTEGAVNPGSIIGPATCDKRSKSELTRQAQRAAAQEAPLITAIQCNLTKKQRSHVASLQEYACNILYYATRFCLKQVFKMQPAWQLDPLCWLLT